MANITEAWSFLTIWYQEISKMNLTLETHGYKNPMVDGTVVSVSGTKAKVKLRNGSEISALVGSFTNVKPTALVLIWKHFKLHGHIFGVPNYVVGSYEIIGIRYFTEKGTLSKTYRA